MNLVLFLIEGALLPPPAKISLKKSRTLTNKTILLLKLLRNAKKSIKK